MKFQLYCSVRQSDGQILRLVRNFDSLKDVLSFINQFKLVLCRDWHLVQRHDNTTEREQKTIYYYEPEVNSPELPF